MNLDTLTNTSFGVGATMLLGRLMPSFLGYRVADLIAWLYSRNRALASVQTVRMNQRNVRGNLASEDELDTAVRHVYRGAARCLYEYYHLSNRPKDILRKLTFSPQAYSLFDRVKNQQSTIVVGVHLSAFDLLLRGLTLIGVKFLVLTISNLNPGYRLQYQKRKEEEVEIYPMGVEAIRLAKKRLRSGGSVLTGLDRPLPQKDGVKYHPRFFGKSSNLPVAYTRLALETGTPVTVVGCSAQPDGTYRVDASDLIVMQPEDDLHASIITNTERVLAQAEIFIRKNANQWSMFYPVWRSDE